jgi:hypothetical protein
MIRDFKNNEDRTDLPLVLYASILKDIKIDEAKNKFRVIHYYRLINLVKKFLSVAAIVFLQDLVFAQVGILASIHLI